MRFKALLRFVLVSFLLLNLQACFWEQARRDYLVTNNKYPDSYMSDSKGNLYPKGFPGSQTIEVSNIEEIKMKADAGDGSAQSSLAQYYLVGFGVSKDIDLGVHFLKLASENGVSSAQHNLAWLYENGTGVEQSWAKAIEHYNLASSQANAHSLNNLGRIYSNAFGVEEDKAKAFNYYKKSADLGLAIAQHNLATFYRLGLSVEKDLLKSRVYEEKACLQNMPEACNALKVICADYGVCEQE